MTIQIYTPDQAAEDELGGALRSLGYRWHKDDEHWAYTIVYDDLGAEVGGNHEDGGPWGRSYKYPEDGIPPEVFEWSNRGQKR